MEHSPRDGQVREGEGEGDYRGPPIDPICLIGCSTYQSPFCSRGDRK
jgi:hypothetical protein